MFDRKLKLIWLINYFKINENQAICVNILKLNFTFEYVTQLL